MGDDSVASTIPQNETRRPKTAAERQRAYRQRKRQQRQIALAAILPEAIAEGLPSDQPVTSAVALPITSNVTVTPVTPGALPVTPDVTPVTLAVALPFTKVTHVPESHSYVTGGRPISSYGLTAAALALAGVGLTMNGWFGRTLGSTDLAGWLFLAVGLASRCPRRASNCNPALAGTSAGHGRGGLAGVVHDICVRRHLRHWVRFREHR